MCSVMSNTCVKNNSMKGKVQYILSILEYVFQNFIHTILKYQLGSFTWAIS